MVADQLNVTVLVIDDCVVHAYACAPMAIAVQAAWSKAVVKVSVQAVGLPVPTVTTPRSLVPETPELAEFVPQLVMEGDDVEV